MSLRLCLCFVLGLLWIAAFSSEFERSFKTRSLYFLVTADDEFVAKSVFTLICT